MKNDIVKLVKFNKTYKKIWGYDKFPIWLSTDMEMPWFLLDKNKTFQVIKIGKTWIKVKFESDIMYVKSKDLLGVEIINSESHKKYNTLKANIELNQDIKMPNGKIGKVIDIDNSIMPDPSFKAMVTIQADKIYKYWYSDLINGGW